MDNGWFEIAQSGGDITALPEIRILVYGTRDKAGDLRYLFWVRTEDEWKTCGEAGC